MNKWIAKPLVGVNNVLFGMPREDVRKTLNLGYKEFKKSKYSKNTTDDFGICHVFYDVDNRCCAIEVFNDVEVKISETIIFPKSLDILKTLASDLEEVENGNYVSKSYSIGIYAPSGKMESILFAGEGYFD